MNRVPDQPITPRRWRLAALGLLGGGLLLGDRFSKAHFAGRSLALAAAGVVAAMVPITIASRRPPIPPATGKTRQRDIRTTFTVLVAARDEAPVLPRLVADVARQTHRDENGIPCFELVLVDDRSTDGTADAVQRAAAIEGIADITRVIRREGNDLPDGKGAALTAAQPESYQGDVVVVLDADARIAPGFLAALAHYVEAGAPAVTPRRRVFGAAESQLAGAQADEQTIDGELQRGRWALGGCSEFRGNGIVVRRDLLADVGGWRAEALTEDLDLSSRVAAAHGVRVAWAIDAEVWEQPVRDWPSLIRQRVRWAEGAIRRAFEHGPAVLRSRHLSATARLDFALYVSQLAVPPVLVGAVGGSLRRGRPVQAASFLFIYGLTGGVLAFDALRWEEATGGGRLSLAERAWRAARVMLFGGLWLLALPGALFRLGSRRGPVGYDKMAHGVAGPQGALRDPAPPTV